MDKHILPVEGEKGEIILYQPDDNICLEVRLDEDTVWLTQQQMVALFKTTKQNISLHINNIFKEGELDEKSNVGFSDFANSDKPVKVYNLDVIISVGYRVKSIRGTQFRQWANKVLKEYLLRGYAVNQRVNQLEDKVDRRFADYDRKIENLNEQVDFFVRTSLPPVEGVFYENQLFDAHILMSQLIESAQKRIVVIDNYVDASVLTLLSKRIQEVSAEIYTYKMSDQFSLDLEKHNAQYPAVEVCISKKSHDRFLIIDDTVYHVGASIKDLGKKLCAVMQMNSITPEEIMGKVKD